MKNNKNYIDFLESLDKEEWFFLFDKIFSTRSLPKPFPFKIDYSDELCITLYKIILESNNFFLLTTYQSFLVKYYFSIPLIGKNNYERIYSLHRVFAQIKSYNAPIKKLFNQFFENFLIDKYHANINLQTSLLSLLIELPNTEDYDLTTHLHNTIGITSDYSYYYVSLKYFLIHKTISEYINYFSNLVIFFKKPNETVVNMLTESLIDLRDHYGCFQKLYEQIDFWKILFNKNPTLISGITTRITRKYLQKGKQWYDNDIFAVLVKIYINSIKYPPPIKTLEEISQILIEKRFHLNKIENLIKKPLSLRRFWMNYDFKIATNNNSLLTEKSSMSFIFLIDNKKNKLDKSLLSYYEKEYNISKRDLLIANPNKVFEDIVYESSGHLQNSSALRAEIKKQKREKEIKYLAISSI